MAAIDSRVLMWTSRGSSVGSIGVVLALSTPKVELAKNRVPKGTASSLLPDSHHAHIHMQSFMCNAVKPSAIKQRPTIMSQDLDLIPNFDLA